MNQARLETFITGMTGIAETTPAGLACMEAARPLLADLVAHDDWLPEPASVPSPTSYRQYLLHCDPAERFCLVSFVWGPGQRTPVHDHTVWGLVGMLRGGEISVAYERTTDGRLVPCGQPMHLHPGQIEAVSPEIGDIHQVRNAYADRTSISIHLYGANIGTLRRHAFEADGSQVDFISGYSGAPQRW